MDQKISIASRLTQFEDEINYLHNNLYPKDTFLVSQKATEHVERYISDQIKKETRKNYLRTDHNIGLMNLVKTYKRNKVHAFLKSMELCGNELQEKKQTTVEQAVVKPLAIKESLAVKNIKRRTRTVRKSSDGAAIRQAKHPNILLRKKLQMEMLHQKRSFNKYDGQTSLDN